MGKVWLARTSWMNLMSLGGSFRLEIQIFEAKMQRKTTEFLKPHSPWLSPCPAPKWAVARPEMGWRKCQRPEIANVKRSLNKNCWISTHFNDTAVPSIFLEDSGFHSRRWLEMPSIRRWTHCSEMVVKHEKISRFQLWEFWVWNQHFFQKIVCNTVFDDEIGSGFVERWRIVAETISMILVAIHNGSSFFQFASSWCVNLYNHIA